LLKFADVLAEHNLQPGKLLFAEQTNQPLNSFNDRKTNCS
jgi:hypothetical protein